MKKPRNVVLMKRICLAGAAAFLAALACQEVAEWMFSAYYREQWGISARIMHSPPFGTNYTEKLAVLRQWGTALGMLAGFIACFALSGRYFSSARDGAPK